MDNITIKLNAERLKLSTSGISRVFNGRPDINKDTRERILAFAREHNFLPNHYTGNLRDRGDQGSGSVDEATCLQQNLEITRILESSPS
jgi:DNA-binding LacI/PurR family transcriptional regulator